MSYILRNNIFEVNNTSTYKNLPPVNTINNGFNSYNPISITRTNKINANCFSTIRLNISNTGNSLVCKYNSTNFFTKKPFTNNLFLVVKQKRFSTPSYSSAKNIINQNNLTFFKNNLKQLNIYLNENRSFSNNNIVSNNKRLLRTRRILVLPASVNIGLITNSFDVMHS